MKEENDNDNIVGHVEVGQRNGATQCAQFN